MKSSLGSQQAMTTSCFALGLLMLSPTVTSHGVIYEPPARAAGGMSLLLPTCAGGSCLWFNQGCTIGCPNATGKSGLPVGPPDCKNHAQPTLKFEDKDLRTYALSEPYRFFDYTKFHPWRYPGSAPVLDPCGISGGWFHKGAPFAGGSPPPGVPIGELGSSFPYNQKLYSQTVWIAGSTAEVAWGITANHGGGYQYRLCPSSSKSTEECFQKMPLRFVGNTQWIQFGHGMDRSNRTEIPATTVTGDKVLPVNSTWRKNPVPACRDPISGGAVGQPCLGPMFEPPIPGLYGFGPGACASSIPGTSCRAKELLKRNFDFGIVDKVDLADVPPGDYVLSFRWESEQTNQIWTSCADVTIKASGQATRPFSPQKGCDVCCPEKQLPCSNCTKCENDKTGACAYCWNPLPGYNPKYSPPFTCLGHEGPDGRAPEWYPGDALTKGWSPGCPKCWSEPGACKPSFRPSEDKEVSAPLRRSVFV